jgi:HK97 family phage prohead protease
LFRGHAAVFGKRAYIGRKPYGFWETVRSGAFAKVISDGDVRLMHNHDPNLVLARSTVKEGPGSLHLEERKKGLHVEAEWVPTSYARDLHALVRSGVINGMSFSFLPVKDDWTSNQEGEETRELLELQVPDVSTVTFPAYSETDAAVRSAGLGLLMDATDLSDEQRLRIVQAVRQGVVTPDLVPALRAASRALVELTERYEPALATRADADDEADVRTEQIFLRARALMALAGDYTKGARVR